MGHHGLTRSRRKKYSQTWPKPPLSVGESAADNSAFSNPDLSRHRRCAFTSTILPNLLYPQRRPGLRHKTRLIVKDSPCFCKVRIALRMTLSGIDMCATLGFSQKTVLPPRRAGGTKNRHASGLHNYRHAAPLLLLEQMTKQFYCTYMYGHTCYTRQICDSHLSCPAYSDVQLQMLKHLGKVMNASFSMQEAP